MNSTNFTSLWQPRILSVLRIVTALLFFEHGASKLLGFPPPSPPSHHPFEIFSFMGFSGILEFVGGILLALGLFSRFTAFILSGEMAVAYFMVHARMDFFPLVNKGELAVLYCFVFFYFVFAGGGAWSLDRLLFHRET